MTFLSFFSWILEFIQSSFMDFSSSTQALNMGWVLFSVVFFYFILCPQLTLSRPLTSTTYTLVLWNFVSLSLIFVLNSGTTEETDCWYYHLVVPWDPHIYPGFIHHLPLHNSLCALFLILIKDIASHPDSEARNWEVSLLCSNYPSSLPCAIFISSSPKIFFKFIFSFLSY